MLFDHVVVHDAMRRIRVVWTFCSGGVLSIQLCFYEHCFAPGFFFHHKCWFCPVGSGEDYEDVLHVDKLVRILEVYATTYCLLWQMAKAKNLWNLDGCLIFSIDIRPSPGFAH